MNTITITSDIPIYCTCGEVLEPAGEPNHFHPTEDITVKPCRRCMADTWNEGYKKGKLLVLKDADE